MTEIRLEHVSYAYDDEKILEDINLEVTSGEVVSILGPSGVGTVSYTHLDVYKRQEQFRLLAQQKEFKEPEIQFSDYHWDTSRKLKRIQRL